MSTTTSKVDAIREVISSNPTMPVSEVIAVVKRKHNLTVAPTNVYSARSSLAKKGPPTAVVVSSPEPLATVVAAPAPPAATLNLPYTMETIRSVKNFSDTIGGTKALLDIAQFLRDLNVQ